MILQKSLGWLFIILMRLKFLNAPPPRAFKLEAPNSAQLFRLISLSVLYLFRLIRLMVFIKLKIKHHKNTRDLHWRNVQMSQDYSNSNCQNSNSNCQNSNSNCQNSNSNCQNSNSNCQNSNSNCQNSNLNTLKHIRLNQASLLCTISNPFKLI